MRQQPAGFPLTVVVIARQTAFGAEAAQGVIKLLKQLREGSSSGVLLVCHAGNAHAEEACDAAREAGVTSKIIDVTGKAATHDPKRHSFAAADFDLVEASDVVVLISGPTLPTANFEDAILAYANGVGRAVIRLDGETGAIRDPVPHAIDGERGWLDELFRGAGLSPTADLKTVQAAMDDLANRAAPITRTWWRWILFLQGLAVLVPLAWLVRRFTDVPIIWVAGVTFATVLLLLGVSWWLRWRGMQKTWARARLVAEVARSLITTADCPSMPDWRALEVVPALRPLRWVACTPSRSIPFEQWRDQYLEKRIEDQDKYFADKQKQAETQRKKLTRWTTLLLDIALAFAFAGAVFAIARYTPVWLHKLEDVRLEIVLGVAGVLMPVGLLLVQLLRGVQELNRRTARFAQQRKMLKKARARLANTKSPDLALQVIKDTEAQLLAEVLEWYFHAETAEHFFHIRDTGATSAAPLVVPRANASFLSRLALTIVGRGGVAGLFLLRVILGRLPWIVASAAAALILIMYYRPTDVKTRAELKPLAHLLDSDGKEWIPTEDKANYGCVIIVHGMYGHVDVNDPTNWPKKCADAISKKLGKSAPNICLVDWREAAQPRELYPLGLRAAPTPSNESVNGDASREPPLDEVVENLSAIRPQAREVGDLLGFELARRILEEPETLRQDRPFHLIGHSAGGFVIGRVAVLLNKLGFFRNRDLLRATILDTPLPDKELLVDLPQIWPTDFCLSSGKVSSAPFRVPQLAGKWWWWPLATPQFLLESGQLEIQPPMEFQLHVVTRFPEARTFWDAHRAAYTWFIKTIENPEPKDQNEGFNRSPVLQIKARESSGTSP